MKVDADAILRIKKRSYLNTDTPKNGRWQMTVT